MTDSEHEEWLRDEAERTRVRAERVARRKLPSPPPPVSPDTVQPGVIEEDEPEDEDDEPEEKPEQPEDAGPAESV